MKILAIIILAGVLANLHLLHKRLSNIESFQFKDATSKFIYSVNDVSQIYQEPVFNIKNSVGFDISTQSVNKSRTYYIDLENSWNAQVKLQNQIFDLKEENESLKKQLKAYQERPSVGLQIGTDLQIESFDTSIMDEKGNEILNNK